MTCHAAYRESDPSESPRWGRGDDTQQAELQLARACPGGYLNTTVVYATEVGAPFFFG